MVEIIAFKCEYCNKIYKIKGSATRHEIHCFANPGTKACRTCEHAKKESNTIYVRPQGDQSYGDADYEEEFIQCEITNKYLSHPSEICHFENGCKYYRQGKKLF